MTAWYEANREIRSLDLSDRGFQYSDGLFETIAIRQGKPRQWRFHLDRLEAGCTRLGLEVAPARLERELDAALARSDLDTSFCVAKLIVTAGPSARGYGRALPTPGNAFVGLFPATPLDEAAYVDGVATILCKTRLAMGSPVAGIKSLNRLEQVLAGSERREAGVYEGLTLDAAGRLICGTISNVFIVKENRIRTPLLERCGVEGTMRRLVVELLGRENRDAELCDLVEEDLAGADEVFITNSQIGAVPVQRCGDYRWAVGPQTREVMRLLADHGIDECRL